MTKKYFTVCILLLAALLPLCADNQVVSSSAVQSLDSSSQQSGLTASWQSYTQQLGLTGPVEIALDYLQEVRTLAARGSIEYPVTVGDVYTLSYIYNNSTVSVPVEISHPAEVTIANIGTFDRTGKTFAQFKDEIESAVRARYPYSNPNLSITATGAFTVHVSGMVSSSGNVSAWGLTRLSDMAYYATDNASSRDVTVISADGTSRHYDLYAARRASDPAQDPLLKSSDRVIFNQRGVTVLVSGSVMRSGTYQLTPEDCNLTALIDEYCLGLDRAADVRRITVTRYENGSYAEHLVSYGDDFELLDGDVITVLSADMPVGSVTLTGALQSSDSASSSNTVQGQVSAQYFYRFVIGQTVGDMLIDMAPYFTASSDLDGCYLTRDGKSYAISFRDVLYGNDPAGDMVLQNGDRFTIPFSNQVVNVNGAVNSPGTYGYVPGKDVSYYVNLAGGLTESARGIDKYRLYNSYGERLDDNTPITAETTIEMEISTFERDLGITVTVVSLVASIVALVAAIVDFPN